MMTTVIEPVISHYLIPGIERSSKTPADIWEKVLETIAHRYGKQVSDIVNIRNVGEIVYMKQLYCYWMRHHFKSDVTYASLACYLRYELTGKYEKKKYDHVSTMHAERVYKDRLFTDERLPVRIRHICFRTKEDFKQIDQLIRTQCL